MSGSSLIQSLEAAEGGSRLMGEKQGQPSALHDEAMMHLDGIVHFSDGFTAYHDSGPAGQALKQWIDGARSLLARATGGHSPSNEGEGR